MIRKARNEDLNEILSIVIKVKKEMIDNGNPQWNSDYPGVKEYMNDIENGELWLEEMDGVILGFMAVNSLFSPEYDSVKWSTLLPANGIHRLAVNTKHHGKGVARRLFAFAEQLSLQEGKKSIRLDTFTLNQAAQKLFLANGYHFAGRIFMKGRSIPYLCFEKSLIDK